MVSIQATLHEWCSATYESDEPVEGEGGRGIVRAIVEGRDLVVLPLLVAVLEERLPRRVQCADWLVEIDTRKKPHTVTAITFANMAHQS